MRTCHFVGFVMRQLKLHFGAAGPNSAVSSLSDCKSGGCKLALRPVHITIVETSVIDKAGI